MRASLLAVFLLGGCTLPVDGEPVDTADSDSDIDTDTETDTDTGTGPDRDGDSFPVGVDCDDSRADVNPGIASDGCNGRDDDCDGTVDEDPDLAWYLDLDSDGFGRSGSSSFVACDPGGDSYASNSADCDDGDDTAYPGAEDTCDGADNDCNGVPDDDPASSPAWYPDRDGDGYGDPDATADRTCTPDSGAVLDPTDCDDENASVHPGAFDLCDAVDNDCDGAMDGDPEAWTVWYVDTDGDGAGSATEVYGCDAASAGGVSNQFDCDDADPEAPVFVDPRGRTRGAGTLADPLLSIQSAIAIATTCVSVGAGDYYENIDFSGKDITVEGVYGSSATTIHGSLGSVVTVNRGETAAAVLRGFTLTGGSGYEESSVRVWEGVTYHSTQTYGGGLYISYASPTLEDLVIADNAVGRYYDYSSGSDYYYGSGYGGGMYNSGGSPTLTDVDFIENTGYLGAAVYNVYGSISGTRVRLRENVGDNYTFYFVGGTGDWENLEVNADTSAYGSGGLYFETSTVTLRNATLVSTDYGIISYGSTVSMESSIVHGTTYGIYGGYEGSTVWSLSYNDIYGNGSNYTYVADVTGSNGNISVDPMFLAYTDDADADGDDLALSTFSSLVDAGNPDAAWNDTDGSRNDIGAGGGPEAR